MLLIVFGKDLNGFFRQCVSLSRCPWLSFPVVAKTSIRWKNEKTGDDGESEPTKSSPTETRQGPTKTTRPGGSGNISTSRC